MDEDPRSTAKSIPEMGSRRRSYRTPRLERLGTLTEITAAVGVSSHMTDHSGGSPDKTA